MAYRFTDTDKWGDNWFSELRPLTKLLFMYLCDLCDIAGFIEINIRKKAFDLGTSKQEVEKGLEEIQEKIMLSKDGRYLFIRNFIKHQKNTDLNEKNNAHKGIIKRLEENLELFGFEDINQFLLSPSLAPDKPLDRGIGKGNGKYTDSNSGIKGGMGGWRESFDIYLDDLRKTYESVTSNQEWIKQKESYHPKLNIAKTLEKSCVEFWATEKGWLHKKKSKSMSINWESTFANALNQKQNKVWKD